MSVINNIPRSLRALVVIAILGVLVWRFAVNTDYYYYCLGAAILIAAGLTLLIYQSPPAGSEPAPQKERKSRAAADNSEDGEPIGTVMEAVTAGSDLDGPDIFPIEDDILDIPPSQRGVKPTTFKNNPPLKSNPPRHEATEAVFKNIQMSRNAPEVKEKPVSHPARPVKPQAEKSEEPTKGTPPVPLIEDKCTLSEEDKNELVNAVWYRCENPYCKYTSFLGVHHILDEKDGGNNKLDNLIVLCPNCHDLAHRGEIPEKEMRAWISRADRFKSKPQWRYY